MKRNLLTTVSKGLGAIHFAAQSTADIVLNLEGNIAEKLGQDKLETMQHRINKTNEYQFKLVMMYAKNLKKK